MKRSQAGLCLLAALVGVGCSNTTTTTGGPTPSLTPTVAHPRGTASLPASPGAPASGRLSPAATPSASAGAGPRSAEINGLVQQLVGKFAALSFPESPPPPAHHRGDVEAAQSAWLSYSSLPCKAAGLPRSATTTGTVTAKSPSPSGAAGGGAGGGTNACTAGRAADRVKELQGDLAAAGGSPDGSGVAPSQQSSALKACLQGAGTTIAIDGCYGAAVLGQDAQIASLNASLATSVGSAHRADVDAAQKQWVTYRDATCRVIYLIFEGGTIRGAETSGCRLARGEERIRELQSYQ